MKKRVFILLPLLLLFLLGLGLVAYPMISSHYTERHQSQVHTQYQEVVEKADGEELDTARAEAEAYNELLASGATVAELEALDYDNLLNLAGNGIMGYIEIPAIDVLLPICHGVGEDSLERGAGHLPSTSLPIGGKGTHTVISAHSGMATARMFTDLEQLEAGDVFYLHVLAETLSYEVDQILVVKPYQIDALKIDREKDYVTLITCTPYGVNSHRLLVRGHRIKPEAEENASNEIASLQAEPKQSTWMDKYWEGIRDGLILFLLVIPVWLAIMLLVKKRRGRKQP
jgi:sortase A